MFDVGCSPPRPWSVVSGPKVPSSPFCFLLSQFQLFPCCLLHSTREGGRNPGRAVQGSRFRVQGSGFPIGCSMLDVRCWMFDVGCSPPSVVCGQWSRCPLDRKSVV